MGRFALRNGPNRSAKRPISHGETAHFATQYGQVLMARVAKKQACGGGMSEFISNFVRRATQAALVRMETRYGTSREQ